MLATVIVIVGVLAAFAESCTLIQPSTDPDWSNMNKDWYDVLNMPRNGGGSIDCFDWLNMTGGNYGFYTDLAVSVEGYPSFDYRDLFDKKRTGVYEMSGDYVDDFIATAKKANEHQLDEELEETIVADAEWMASREIAIVTDNQNYMIFTMCTNWGPITWIKFPSKSPSISQITDAWNALISNNLMNTVQYNDACA